MRAPAARRPPFPSWSGRPRGSDTSDARRRVWERCRASWESENPAREQRTVAKKSGNCVEAQGSTAWRPVTVLTDSDILIGVSRGRDKTLVSQWLELGQS